MPILTRGMPAPGGVGGGSGFRIFNETPGGVQNGSNLVFTTSVAFEAGTEAVSFNGVRQTEGVGCDYVRSESGGAGTGFDTITFAADTVPFAVDELLIDFDPA
jgi:hypothetical protein